MYANKEEAAKCLEIAKKYLKQGNEEAAQKFFKKAARLDPSLRKKSCSDNIETEHASQRSRSRSVPKGNLPTDTPNRDKSKDSKFTKADVESVRSVLACSDLYKVLGIAKDASDDDIKKAYKGLARKFHPDKNQAPGATEAFKKIGSASQVLLNAEQRRRYDKFGTVGDTPPSVTRHRNADVFYQFDGNQGFDADVFNIFFNGGFPFSQVYRNQRGPTRQTRHTDQEHSHANYLQLLPLLILFGVSFFSNLLVKDPYFSLTRNSKYPIERITIPNKVPYYVKTSFSEDYDGPIHNLEVQVEEQYAYYLRDRCFKEKSQKEAQMHRARFMRDNEAFERARQYPTPSCDRVVKFYA